MSNMSFILLGKDTSRFRDKTKQRYLTLKKIARMFNTSPKRIRSLAKWYAVMQGKELGDFAVQIGKKTIVYDMPPDFLDFVKRELEGAK